MSSDLKRQVLVVLIVCLLYFLVNSNVHYDRKNVPNPPLYYIDSNAERETLKKGEQGIKSEFFANSKQTEFNIYSKLEIKAKIKASEAHKFTVEGWPESKSRSAEDYVNYVESTETLIPKRSFSSWNAGNNYSRLSSIFF